MAAEPHDPDGSLEARVTRLEHQADNVTPQALAATNYAVSLVHADTTALRRDLATVRDRVIQVAATQQEHGELLEEILRRLPPAPG
jgi:hypothetical protein